MTEQDQVPEPAATGIEGGQKPAATDAQIAVASPLAELPLVRRIEGLASTHSRALGGEVAAALIAGATTQIAHDLGETKGELGRTRERFDAAQTHLAECRERNAVLNERLRSEKGSRHLRNLGIAIGTALMGVAIELYSKQFTEGAVVTFALGALLLALGWFTGPRSEDK